MKKGETYFKYSALLICAVMLFLLLRRCGNEAGSKHVTDTVSVTVTKTIEVVKTDTHYIPKIRKINTTDTEYVYMPKMVRQPGSTPTTTYYSDTIPNKYGNFIVNDTLRGDSIIGRGIKTNISVPTITKTYTIQAQQRTIVYMGAGLIGNQGTPLFGTSANLALKTKNDKVYSIGAVLTKGGQVYYTFNFLIPIRLTKK